jgi:hypothetical protein
VKRALPVARPIRRSTRSAPPRLRTGRLLVLVVALGFVAVGLKHWLFPASSYEAIARDVTIALQHDDLATVDKYQNAETAAQLDHARVGRAADALAPLGDLKSVKETDAVPDRRIYDFDLTFADGTLHEKIMFDPQNKIVAFHYDAPQLHK